MYYPIVFPIFLMLGCGYVIWILIEELKKLDKIANRYLDLLNRFMEQAGKSVNLTHKPYADIYKTEAVCEQAEDLLETLKASSAIATTRFSRSQEKSREICELAEVVSELLKELPDKRAEITKRLTDRDVKVLIL